MTPAPRPNRRQIARYIAGRPLPEQFNAWVINDITGPGSTRHYATRCIVPLLPLLGACLLVPGPLFPETWYQQFHQKDFAAALVGSSREACRIYVRHFLTPQRLG